MSDAVIAEELRGGRTTLVVVDVAGRRCALPAEHVREIHAAVLPTPLPGAPEVVVGAVNRRGHVIAVLDLRLRFSLPTRPLHPDDRLVVVEVAGRDLALLVEGVEDVTSVDTEQIDQAATDDVGSPYTGGLAVLEGDLVVVADLEGFLSGPEAVSLDEAVAAARGTSG